MMSTGGERKHTFSARFTVVHPQLKGPHQEHIRNANSPLQLPGKNLSPKGAGGKKTNLKTGYSEMNLQLSANLNLFLLVWFLFCFVFPSSRTRFVFACLQTQDGTPRPGEKAAQAHRLNSKQMPACRRTYWARTENSSAPSFLGGAIALSSLLEMIGFKSKSSFSLVGKHRAKFCSAQSCGPKRSLSSVRPPPSSPAPAS